MEIRYRTRETRPTEGGLNAFGRWPLTAMVFLAVLTGCDQSATGLDQSEEPNLAGDPAMGQVAFVQECATCHASHDGFDLAAFRFSKLNVFRRSLGHVDEQTSKNIAAYIETLRPAVTFDRAPFQPGDRLGSGNREFWRDAFGTDGFPYDLTPERLRAIDVRGLQVPLAMPEWSIEASTEDWMPDSPLPTQILEYDNARIGTALETYYANPTEPNLLAVLAPFKAATEGPGLICWDYDPDPCFDARRWMASLGAQHYLRQGPDAEVPLDVVQVWWDVGRSAISLNGETGFEGEYEGFDRPTPSTYIIGARWTYLAYSYYPEAFNDDGGYMGVFIEEQGLNRVSTFAALRRMVGDGRAHQEHPDQFLQDGYLAIKSSDPEVGAGVTEFVFKYFVDRLEAGRPEGLNLKTAREMIALVWNEGLDVMPNYSADLSHVEALRDRVNELLR